MLSDKDALAKTPRITPQMFLYVPDEVNRIHLYWSKCLTTYQPKDEDVHEEPQTWCASKMKSTVASSCWKQKWSLTASPECSPPTKCYQSLYRSRQSATAPVLEYETFKMKQAVCSVSETGELTMDYSEEPEDTYQGCWRLASPH
jgi:hypothetical protein